ncbi:MAG: hypothetical protein VR65_16620 [Desulfobulbaceae bacterium BRH_c16a]|nr:MAG: hypothetical protein VR65_16620 [Desulfobulbaceae bacterium BRH_c16a]
MKTIKLDVCNGLDSISIHGTSIKPEPSVGMVVALCHNETSFKVEIKSTSTDKKQLFGEVIKSEPGHLEKCGLEIGKQIEFTEINICYPTQKD